MLKNKFTWMLTGLLVAAVGMNVAACSDDDENNEGSTADERAQDPYEKQSEAADALYRLATQLSVCDSLPDNWKETTFEPRVGKVLDASQPLVRTLTVSNATEAVAYYNSLTGKDMPAATTTDTYQVDGVGTLQLNVGANGTIATIDVSVKQMPKLSQLRLVSTANIGENGTFKGTPYYRFGDVVKDKDGCCWICVRPAYSPDSKEDTHWMSFHLITDNFKSYTKTKCKPQVFPVNLGVEKTKMQYLPQLLAILASPADYKTLAGTDGKYYSNSSMGLGGLQPSAMTVDTLIIQSKLWDRHNIWSKIMPQGNENNYVNNFKQRFQNDVSFIYEKGSTSGTKLYIYTATYTGAGQYYKNDPTYAKITVDMTSVEFDMSNKYVVNGLRGNESYPVPDAFIVRYKSGFQLSSNWFLNPDPTKAIEGVTEIHRLNSHLNEVTSTI